MHVYVHVLLNVAKHMSLLHDKYVIVSADKTPSNIVLCVNHITSTTW